MKNEESKYKKMFEILFLVCFILTIVLMCLKNLFCLFTFGLLFILTSSNKFEVLNDTKHGINYMQRKYGNYNMGKFQQKIAMAREKEGNHLFFYVGFSMCIWYIFCLLIKYNIWSFKYLLGVVLPLHFLSFFIFLEIEEIIIIILQKKHKANYNIKILAECIDVHENILYAHTGNDFGSSSYRYIVTYKFNYNDKEYIVSSLEPQPYLYVPVCGKNYEIFINDEAPNDFTDENTGQKLNISMVILFGLISTLFLCCSIYVWVKYLK